MINIIVWEIWVMPGPTDSKGHQGINHIHSRAPGWKTGLHHPVHGRDKPTCFIFLVSLYLPVLTCEHKDLVLCAPPYRKKRSVSSLNSSWSFLPPRNSTPRGDGSSHRCLSMPSLWQTSVEAGPFICS